MAVEQHRPSRELATHKDLAPKLEALEEKDDAQFKVVFDAIRRLMAAPTPKAKRIDRDRKGLGDLVEIAVGSVLQSRSPLGSADSKDLLPCVSIVQ